MAVSANSGSNPGAGLFGSIRSFGSVLLAIFHTRLELASLELEDEVVRGIKLAIAGTISLLAFFAAFFWANFFILALFWNTEYRLWVLGLIFTIYFAGGVISLLIARNMILHRPRFLAQTIDELRRDLEGLNRTVAVQPKETKS